MDLGLLLIMGPLSHQLVFLSALRGVVISTVAIAIVGVIVYFATPRTR